MSRMIGAVVLCGRCFNRYTSSGLREFAKQCLQTDSVEVKNSDIQTELQEVL